MPDRDTVISRIETICEICKTNTWRTEFDSDTIYPLLSDAIALLKEQEAVEPEVEVLNEIDRLYRCAKCHKCFFYEKQKFCDQCGQAVKWND